MRSYHWFWIVALLTFGDAHAAAITVNTTVDEFGSGANCSLREAVESTNSNANFGGCIATGTYILAIADVINVPSGTITLTRIGTDDTNNSGDLDIDGRLAIDGVSAANSVIRGDTTDDDSDRHRLVHIQDGSVVVLSDLTLRDGLEDGSTAGGGLRSELNTTTTLNRVTVTLNTAGGNAGGILNRKTMIINDSLISNNQTVESDDGGGGIFSSGGGTLTINNSRILDNIVNSSADGTAGGGGIYIGSNTTLTLNNSVVDGNLADGRRLVGDRDAFGGGLYFASANDDAGTITLVQSSITNNDAIGRYSHGGGIYSETPSEFLVDRSVISSNLAMSQEIIDGQAYGGGFEAEVDTITIQDSVISGNQASAGAISQGGGLRGMFRILRSTVADNKTGGPGGGLHTISSVVINSTFIGNEAGEGGGMFFSHSDNGTSQVFSSTFAGNSATDTGGGIKTGLGEFTIANTVLASNTAANGGPNCAGTMDSQGFNLVQNNSGCGLVADGNDKINLAASLGPIANNGGVTAGSSFDEPPWVMETHAPLPNSLLVDAGNIFGCKDDDDVVLATDQIGSIRALDGPDLETAINCDIGAIEYTDELFSDGFE